jgi:hypothetical protein
MRIRASRSLSVLGLSLVAALGAPAVRAALGGDVRSVMHDHAALGLSPSVTSTANFDLYEGQTGDGTRLREYVDHSGKVFALSYQAPVRPQLAALLGSYASRKRDSVGARQRSRHLLVINDPDFALTVVHMGRGWRMQAELPTAVPAGVDRSELR